MPDVPRPSVIAALLVFRLFYFWLPFAISVVVVLLFERSRLAAAFAGRGKAPQGVPEPPLTAPGLYAHAIEQGL